MGREVKIRILKKKSGENNKMTLTKKAAVIVDRSQCKAARVAGFMFLFSLIVPLVNWAFVLSKLIVGGNATATAKNIIANEFLFRVGLTVELIMSAGLVVLGCALYIILKPVNKNLAGLGLFWKLVEAVLVAVIVLVSFIALQISTGEMEWLVGIVLNEHTVLYSVAMVFLGLNMVVFFYLFFKSKYIPRVLAGFGMISYALILIHALGNILAPNYATMQIIEIIFYTPSCILELAVGGWLLFKGINTQHGE